MTSRGTIFADAFEAIGIANYVFGTDADEQASAARKLDAMMAEEYWSAIDYTQTGGEPQPDASMTTDPQFDSAISYNLALRLAPSFGKEPSGFVKAAAKRGYAAVVAATLKPPALPANRIPILGGGDWRRRWILP